MPAGGHAGRDARLLRGAAGASRRNESESQRARSGAWREKRSRAAGTLQLTCRTGAATPRRRPVASSCGWWPQPSISSTCVVGSASSAIRASLCGSIAVVRAPHEQHRAADADEVERRVAAARARARGRTRAARRRPRGSRRRGRTSPRSRAASRRVLNASCAVRARAARARTSSPGTGDRHREQPADDRVLLDRVEPGRQLEPVGRDRDDAGEVELAGVLGEPQREAAAERGARDDHRLAVRPRGHELGGERVELREHRAGRSGVASPKPGRSTAIARRPRAASSRQQRAPRVGRVAPAVQQHDAGALAVHLERARRMACKLDAVLDDRGHVQRHTRSSAVDDTVSNRRQLCWTR